MGYSSDEDSMEAGSTTTGSSSEDGHSGNNDANKDDSRALKPVVANTAMEVLSGGIAVASVGTSVAAMLFYPVTPVYVAGALSSVIGPYAYFQQTRLTDIAALQETHKALSEQVDRLSSENDRLHETVADLSATVDRLEDVQQALDVITQTQGQSVEALEEVVAENREILGKMQSNLKANVLQNLLQVVIRSDSDENMTIEEHEIGDLVKRIQGINGVQVHEDRFRSAIEAAGGSLQCVMDIIKNLMADNISGEDAIFTIIE